jgi:hypothetical protein
MALDYKHCRQKLQVAAIDQACSKKTIKAVGWTGPEKPGSIHQPLGCIRQQRCGIFHRKLGAALLKQTDHFLIFLGLERTGDVDQGTAGLK